MPESVSVLSVVQTHSNRGKMKRSQIMSDESIIIPKIQWNPDFSKLSAGKGNLVRKITVTVFDRREGNYFWSDLSGG